MKLAAITTLMFFAALTSAKEHMPEEFQCMGACKISGEVQCIGSTIQRCTADSRRRPCWRLYEVCDMGCNETDLKPHCVKDEEISEGVRARMAKLEFEG